MSDGMDIEALIAALAAPGALPMAGDGLTQVVQTHISAVFLAGEHAFKLKKPVDFGFLDFSTPEKRAHFCREELRLNRRLAPEFYVGLAPVWLRPKGIVEVGQPSETPPPCDELLVVMKRLPQERMMDKLLAEGALEARHVERLARLVAAFHARAEAGVEIEKHGTRDAAGRLAIENFDQTEVFRGRFVDPRTHHLMRARTTQFLETRERLFRTRVAAGRVRDCHGDLHSPNVCILADGKPVVYDCIEFSPAYRCGDVASEVAFTAMDLEFRGRADLADAFVETYGRIAGDPTLEAALPFYKAYRAMVRAKISSLTASATEVDEAVRARAADDARKLYALAERYTRGLVPPTVIVLSGLTGVGKTAVADKLRRAAGLAPLETDRIRKELAGLDPSKPAPAGVGQGIYTHAMTAATYRTLARGAAERIEQGDAPLAVGTFVAREQRKALRDVAAEAKTPLLFVRLTAPQDVVEGRLTKRQPGMSDGTDEVYRSMLQRAEAPDEIAESERLDVDTSNRDPETSAEVILARLRGE